MNPTRSENHCTESSPDVSAMPSPGDGGGQAGGASSNSPPPARSAGAKKTVRLLVADDHPIVRRGIAAMLARQPQFEVVGEAGDGREALRQAKELLPDIILADLEMPHLNGLALIEALRKELPQVRVLVISMHANTDFVLRIMEAGAKGYVLKDVSSEELIKAIQTVEAGECYYSADITRVALNQYVRGGRKPAAGRLTARERQVLAEIARGFTNKEIGVHLGIGVRTIETHRERIMRKLEVRGVAALTRYAIAQGLVAVRE